MIPNATDDLGHIHDRVPMTVARDNWTDRLDPRCRTARHGRPARGRSVARPAGNPVRTVMVDKVPPAGRDPQSGPRTEWRPCTAQQVTVPSLGVLIFAKTSTSTGFASVTTVELRLTALNTVVTSPTPKPALSG